MGGLRSVWKRDISVPGVPLSERNKLRKRVLQEIDLLQQAARVRSAGSKK